ncbi:MAG: hypothetical protein P1V51_04270 [Deltaproteobacteria bacterium]|nr:hypothetical protein [Deltaproteobacteria bacterium]
MPAGDDLLAELISTTWTWRWKVLGLCVLTGLVASGTSLLRANPSTVQIQIAIGTVPTGEQIETARVVSTRATSRTYVERLLSEQGEDPVSLPETMVLKATAGPEGKMVALTVESEDPVLATRVAQVTAQAIVGEHARMLEGFIAARQRQIAENKELLAQLEKAITAPQGTSTGGQAPSKRSEEEGTAWAAAVGLIKHISKLEDENQEPHARASTVIFGPDVQARGIQKRAIVSGVFGFGAGFLFFAFLVLARLAAAPYLKQPGE